MPNQLQVSRVSGGPSFIVDMSGNRPQVMEKTTVKSAVSLADTIPGKYVVCLYDRQWWIGNIRAISEEEQDVQVTFMHPHGPSQTYSWPRREDNCWVPLVHIMKIIDAPLTSTGRQYKLPSDVEKQINALFKLFK